MNYPPPQPQPPLQPAKRKVSGCLLAAGIVAALTGMALVGIGLVVWRSAHSATGQKIIENTKVMIEATTAPGAAEVKALGCSQALVIDAERLSDINAAGTDGGTRSSALKDVKRTVVCQVTKRSPALTCEAVAAAYRAAVVTPPGKFSVTVAQAGGGNACSVLFDAAGAKLGDLVN